MRRLPNNGLSIVLPITVVVLLVAVWEVVGRISGVPDWLLPLPSAIAREFGDAASLQALARGFGETLGVVAVGLAVAIVLALLMATAMALSRTAERSIFPILLVIQTLPVIALTPLIVVWFGIGLVGKVVVVTMIAFFPLAVTTTAGLKAAPAPLFNLFRTFGASRLQIFTKLEVPMAIPSVITGLKVTVAVTVVGAFVAEYAFGSTGLGHLIKVAGATFQTERMFAAVLLLCLVAVVLYLMVKTVEITVVAKYRRRV